MHSPRPLCCRSTIVGLSLGVVQQVWVWELVQSVLHTMNDCPNTVLPDGGLWRLHFANKDAVNWLEQTVTKALAGWKARCSASSCARIGSVKIVIQRLNSKENKIKLETTWTQTSANYKLQESQPKQVVKVIWQKDHIAAAHGRYSLYFTMGHPFPQNCPFPWGIWTPSDTWFLQPTWVLSPNGILIGAAIFAGLTIMTD